MKKKKPKDKYMGTVKVGEKGQIVIPKDIRDIFGIEPGDTLLIMADKKRGIAIPDKDGFAKYAKKLFAIQQADDEEDEE